MVAASHAPRDALESLQGPFEAARPMAVGGLTAVVAISTLSGGRVNHAVRTVEHALLCYFVVDLALEVAIEGSLGAARLIEAAVLVPYAALVGLETVSLVACHDGPLAPVFLVLYDLHGGVAICRAVAGLDIVAGASLAAIAAEYLPTGGSDEN